MSQIPCPEKQEVQKGDGEILGHYPREYPCQFGYSIILTTVLVAGQVGDYACYTGYGTKEFVAEQGDKLSFDEARCYFPGIEKEKYRL